MKKCAFLSMDSLDEFVCYDHLLFEPLRENGWLAQEISWRDGNVNWADYNVVIIRSPWDYQDDPHLFLEVLKKIEGQTVLQNPLDLVKWNLHKSYLMDLEQKGIEIVLTRYGHNLQQDQLVNYFEIFCAPEIIIKPVISANADDTFRLTKNRLKIIENDLVTLFRGRSFMVQPFMDSIIKEGEYSLFYFDGNYSHAILKKPAENDYRVQEEHGGLLFPVHPKPALSGKAQLVMDNLRPSPLYARADFVRTAQDSFALMELELIEPSLYFNMDKKAVANFVSSFCRLF